MKTALFIAFIKVLSGLLSLVVAAGAKWLKERNERKAIRHGTLKALKKYPMSKRLFIKDGPDEYMNEDHPQTVFFQQELISNAYRPIVILMVVSLFSYNTIEYKWFLAFIALSFPFIEFSMDELKEKNWFKCTLIFIWIITFFIILCGERQLQKDNDNSKNDVTTQTYDNSSDTTEKKPLH